MLKALPAALAALIVPIAFASAAAAEDSHDREMRSLFNEYNGFKNAAKFRQFGYSQKGPVHRWSERIAELNGVRRYSQALLERCQVVPLDLLNAGVDAYGGQQTALRTDIESKFSDCFK